MKYVLTATIAFVAVALVATPATADWNEGDPYKMHFPQLPDRTPNGVDVLGTYPYLAPTAQFGKILADDWKCSQDGLVSDIHIWSSWLYDELPFGTLPDGTGTVQDPRAVGFKLSIHANVPADPNNGGYSHPGVELWGQVFNPFDPRVKVRPEDAQGPEMFWDPNPQPDGEELGSDNIIWQYNFFMRPEDTPQIFEQKEGEIYWLNVMAVLPIDQPGTLPLWGWKTADRFQYPDDPARPELHFEDDAVFADIDDPWGPADPGIVFWQPLKYPSFHEFAGQSMDLAFVITPEPGTVVMLIGAGLIGLVAYARRRRKS